MFVLRVCMCFFFACLRHIAVDFFGWCFSDRWRLNYAQIKCFLINFPPVVVRARVWVVFFSHFFRFFQVFPSLSLPPFLSRFQDEKVLLTFHIALTNTLWCPTASDTRNICKFSSSERDKENWKKTTLGHCLYRLEWANFG